MIKRKSISIPEKVMDQIISEMPDLSILIGRLKEFDGTPMVGKIEKQIADLVCSHVAFLTALETWNLSKCTVGKSYGES